MSFVTNASTFDVASSHELTRDQIQDLTAAELELVNGGAIWAPILACAASTLCKVAVLAAAGAGAALIGYENNRV